MAYGVRCSVWLGVGLFGSLFSAFSVSVSVISCAILCHSLCFSLSALALSSGPFGVTGTGENINFHYRIAAPKNQKCAAFNVW